MTTKAVNEGSIHGIRVAATAPVISNLCCADDTLFFSNATNQDAITLKSILEKYAKTSGQEINLDKSTVVFSPSTPQDIKDSVSNILGFKVVEKHERYLGMPCSMGRSRKEVFGFLRDRIWNKINGWGEKLLSRAGKEVLIKSVLQSIPTYIMSCFLLPKRLLGEMVSQMRRYWWGNGSSKGMVWLPWKKLCLPKGEGGMGFRDMECFNLALLAKQGWRIISQPDLLLSRILKARYYPSGDFFSAAIGSRPSATWRSILAARQYLKMGLRRRIGNGRSTSIWGDQWIEEDGNMRIITKCPRESSFPNVVADIIDPHSYTWNVSLINQYFWTVDRDRILSISIGGPNTNDRTIWHYAPKGNFTVNSCYNIILTSLGIGHQNEAGSGQAKMSGESNLARWIWTAKIPPKIRIFLWRARLNILPTSAELFRRRILTNPFCALCGKAETLMHTILECRHIKQVWIDRPFEVMGQTSFPNLDSWLEYLRNLLTKEQIWLAMIVMWKLWDLRNKFMHGEERMDVETIVGWSRDYLNLYQQSNKSLHSGHITTHPSSWLPPDQGVIKINVDVAFPTGMNFYITAMVARDCNGECLWWKIWKMLGRPPVSSGETFGVLHALQLAKEKGWNTIVIEGDNLQVMTALMEGECPLAPFGAIVEQCLAYARGFNRVSFQFIKRTGNHLAHELAKLYEMMDLEGFILPPSLVMNI